MWIPVVQIILPGDPIAKQRPRFTRFGIFDKQKPLASRTSNKMQQAIGCMDEAKERNAERIKQVIGDYDAMKVNITFFMPIPQSISAVQKNRLLWQPDHVVKPDLDNMAKFYLDCGNGTLWTDDCKISELNCCKRYARQPRTVIDMFGKKEKSQKELDIISAVFSPEEFLAMIMDFPFHDERLVPSEEEQALVAKESLDALSNFAHKHAQKLLKLHKKVSKR